MSGFGAFMRGLFKEGFFTLIFEGLKWGAPILAAVVTTVVGYIQNFPWFYIIIGAIIAFAMMATGLRMFDEWLARITPRNKLVFRQAIYHIIPVKDTDTGKWIRLKEVQPVLILFNSSNFPIEFYVDEISSSMEGHFNPKPILNNRGVVLQPASQASFVGASINMANFQVKPVIDGMIDFKLSYGRNGNKKYKLEKHLNLTCP